MENAVTERVNVFREQEGLSITAMAKALGIGQTTLNKQLKDDGYGVSLSTILLILSTYPDLSAEWLLRGDGSMVRESEEKCGRSVEKDGRGTVKALGQQELVDALKDHIATLKADKQRLLNEIDALRREKSLSDGFGYSMVAEEIEYNKKEG